MSSGQIVLFDIPSKTGKPWSLNPWKTRLLLNYKGLDYKTEWVEYPNIKPRLEPHVPPNGPQSMAPYTIPTIMLPSGQYVMDSLEIAKVLEKEYPSPSAHVDSPYYDRLLEQTKAAMAALPSVYVTNVYDRVLGEASRPYFHETRTKYLGMPIEEYLAKHPVEESFQAAEQYLRNVTALLKENGQGPFLMGREVCYADFVWGGFLLFFKVMGEDVWERFLKATGDAKVHLDFLEALEPWTKKVD